MRSSPLSCHALLAFAGTLTYLSAAEPVTVVFQNGLNGYEQTFDRRIGPAGEVNGLEVTGQTGYYIDGGADALNDNGFSQGLLRFSGVETLIPAGAKIVDAKITVVTKTHGNAQSGDSFTVYRLSRPFNEESGVNTDFGTDGLYGDVDMILGSFHGPNIGGEASVVSADVTRAVQSWIDGSPNNGVGIRSDRGTNGWSFHTTGATATLRPKLEVTYIVGTDTRANDYQQGLNGYTGSIDIFLNGQGATSLVPGNTIVGSTVAEAWLDGLNPPTTEPDISGMVRFSGIETELSGRKIEKATLKVVTGFSSSAADSAGPFTVHRLLVPFSETSKYSDFAGDAGAMLTAGQITPAIATFTDMQDCEVVDVDITDAVKAWAAGEPNHGFYIGSGTPNGWQLYTTGAPENTDGGLRRPLLRVISSPALPVEIINPTNASRHVIGTPMTFQASTSVTAPATATKVEFFINGVKLGEDTSAPFTYSYPADKYGNYALTATLTDSTGKVTTGETVNFSVVPPAGAGGLYFDGLYDHVALGDPAALKLSTFTVETWFRRESAGVATTTGTGGVVAIPLVAKGRNQADNSTLDTNWFVGIRESDGVLCGDFEGAGGVNVPVAGRTVIPYGAWQHAAATFDGTHWRLYLNGNLEVVLEAPNGLTPRADSIQHASIATAMNSNGLGEGAFGGFMDEVRVWNVARSQAEIRTTIHSEVSSDPALVARWGMNEGSGSTITSSASAGTVGTFSGSPMWAAGQTFSGNVLPSISFTGPAAGGTYLSTDAPQFTVTTNDPDGTVSKVEYFDNGVSIGVVNSAPFSFSYLNPSVGTRRIEAVVTDNAGGTSRTDNLLTIYVTFPSPTVPGYSAGIINGGDIELSTGTPPVSPTPWTVFSGSSAPRAFTAPGTALGDIAANVNGSPLSYSAGVLLTTNAVVNDNFAPLDNIVSPYESGGVYRVRSMDNNGPGEAEPQISPESSSFALGWFPYAQGWIGANVAADGTIATGSNSLPSGVSIVRRLNTSGAVTVGRYVVRGLPESGNLIAVATGSANDNVACASFEASTGHWLVDIRDNNQNAEEGDFAFVYVPRTANRVISGSIGAAAEVVTLNLEAEMVGIHAETTPQGYQLTFGDGTAINPSNTALFISADGTLGNGMDNIYSYVANGNSFVVFSHDLPGLNLEFQTGGFRFIAVPLNPSAPGANEVAIRAKKSVANEDGTDRDLTFTVTRNGPVTSALTVNYSVGGTATPGSDFTSLPGSVVIPAGSSSAEITVTALADTVLEPVETVTLTVVAGSGYTPGGSTTATGRINDSAPNVESTTIVFQEGLNGYTGQFQKRVGYAMASGTYTAQLGSAVASYGIDGGDPDINDLIRFDNIIGGGQGQIPSGARILKAELVVVTATSDNAQSGGPFVVDRLVSPVDANTTYDSITMGTGFEGVRGITSQLPAAGFPPLEQGETGAADVTDIVRSWIAGEPNHGFGVFAAATTDGWNYCTVGNTNVALRPKLVVTYTTQATREYTLKTDLSARVNSAPGSVTQDGSTLDIEFLERATNKTNEAFLRFPVAFGSGENAIPAGERIVKAELLMTTAQAYYNGAAHTVGPVRVHQVLKDWNASTSYGLYGPRIGTDVAESAVSMSGLGLGSTSWVDVTSIVRSWQAGAPNYGINLRLDTTNNWMFFWPGSVSDPNRVPRLRITTVTDDGGPQKTPFELWAEAQGAAGATLDSDNDGDGISLLVEYALGLNGNGADSLPGVVRNGGNLSLTFPKGTEAAGDTRVTYEIVSSTDLVNWVPATGATNENGAISITEPVGTGPKFFRLKVAYAP